MSQRPDRQTDRHMSTVFWHAALFPKPFKVLQASWLYKRAFQKSHGVHTHSLQSDKPYCVQIRTVRYYQRLVCYDSAVIKKNLRSHLIVECLLALEMLLPVTTDERLFPPWRSSIDRFQGLDLSTVFSVLFSELSPSYLSNAQQQGLRNNIILFFCCCFFCTSS